MLSSIISFLVLLNPLSLYFYLQPVMRELSKKEFREVLFRASFISFLIYVFFLYAGEFIFDKVLRINFEAFRMFGGIIFFMYAYMFIIHGKKSLITLKENLDDLANEIALPFMAGAGTISLSVLMGQHFAFHLGLLLLVIIMLANYLIIILLITIRDLLSQRMKVAFDKNMEIGLRLNGLFAGAIGLNMIFVAVDNLFLK